MARKAFKAAIVHDGMNAHGASALLLEGGVVSGICPSDSIPDGFELLDLGAGTLCPGFIDLQVNGGGGLLLNDAPSLEGVARVSKAHAALGTTGLLPTLITDRPEITTAAIDAVVEATAQKMPGILGLHLEGPHLALAKCGAHDPELIRPMNDADLRQLVAAAKRLPNLLVTLAPETVRLDQIEALAEAGVIVSLGHSNADYATAMAAFDAGAQAATHLFNAMSQLDSRNPGLVGAALDHGAAFAGLIADTHHVHPASLRAALAAKTGPGRLFLVSDAMAIAGTQETEFCLGGRRILRQNGRLTLEDGTLAGADLDVLQAVRMIVEEVGVVPEQAIAMASGVPVGLLKDIGGQGRFTRGTRPHPILLSPDLSSFRHIDLDESSP